MSTQFNCQKHIYFKRFYSPSRQGNSLSLSLSLSLTHTHTYIYIYIHTQALIHTHIYICWWCMLSDRSWRWLKGSFFNSYNTELLGRALLLSLDCSTFSCFGMLRRKQVQFFESLVWLDLGLNPGIPGHWVLSIIDISVYAYYKSG